MGETNITIDAQGNITRGVPGQMSELDVEHEGGHVTGRTEHVQAKDGKSPTPRKSNGGRKKDMSLDQLIGRSGSSAGGTVEGPQKDSDATKSKATLAGGTKKAEKGGSSKGTAKQGKAVGGSASKSEAAKEPAPDSTEKWTGSAKEAAGSDLPYLTIEHAGFKLHFTQSDIDTARAQAQRDELEQAIVDYGDKMDKERREQEDKERATREAQERKAAEEQAKAQREAEERERKAAEEQARKDAEERARQEADEAKRQAEEEERARQEAEQRAAQEADATAVQIGSGESAAQSGAESAEQPKSDGGHESGQAPQSGQSRELHLGSSAPGPNGPPVVLQSPGQTGPVGQFGPAATEASPLRRVSVQDVCSALELDINALRESLKYGARGAFLGIHPELFLYCTHWHDGGQTYLFGYGPNIAYVRSRDGMLTDCNNNFGIDEICAWVNGMTWVVRYTGA